jgi:SAM-dependent methyltransferase
MSIRYLIDPNRQAANRFDREFLDALFSDHELKAESTQPLREASEKWQAFYSTFSKALFTPRIQIFHGQLKDYVPHPLQWNILCQPENLPASDYDEVWSFSAADQERLQRLGCPADKLFVFEDFSPDTNALKSHAELPITLEGESMIFCSLRQLGDLEQILTDYLRAHGDDSSVMLALHLDVAIDETEAAETLLLENLEKSTAALQRDMESLNIGTFIGPLTEEAYLACLQQSKALWWAQSFFQAQEAKASGLTCLGGPYAHTNNPNPLSSAPQASDQEFFAPLSARLHQLLNSVDFGAREAAYQAVKALEQQGRKQKYSLFHSDYNSDELKARRNWHATYAREFKDCPGDVLDIGSGSGLFLEIMRDDLQQPAFGIDPDEDMVKVCQKLGLSVLPGDERTLADFQMDALGGIHASHIIEHIDGSRAIALVENAFRVLRPGGLLLIRTPNWRNETVRQEGFWLDITHIRPYPLPLLKQVLQDAGFTITKEGFETFGWNDTYILGQKPLSSLSSDTSGEM